MLLLWDRGFAQIQGWKKPQVFFIFFYFLGFNVRTVARGHWTQEYDQEEGLYTNIK